MDAFAGTDELTELATKLGEFLTASYEQRSTFVAQSGIDLAVPEAGLGPEGVPILWRALIEGAAPLASPSMSGHMDTAPHPVAALTQAVISALNNNLLFRELSPLSSQIEESLIGDFTDRLGLSESWTGTWVSGGSLANLTAFLCRWRP